MSPRLALPIGTLAFTLALVRCGSSAVAPSIGPPVPDGGTDAGAGSGGAPDAGAGADVGVGDPDGGRADAGPGTDAGSSTDGGQGGQDGGLPDDAGSGGPDGGGPDAGPAPGTFRLLVQLPGPGSGQVTSQPPGIACPGTCSADFPSGNVTLSAQPGAGSALAYWGGACRGANATCTASLHATLAATQERVAIADFEPPPPVSYSVQEIPKSNLVLGVNSAGNATGVGYGGPSLLSDAYFFDASTGRSTFISFSSRETSHAQGINDRNVIVANVMMDRSDGFHLSRTVRWENGAATDLGTLGGGTWGFGINGSNQVVGWFVRTDGNQTYTRAFFHDGQRMSDLGSLDGTCSEAHAVDSAGTAVGSSCVGTTQHAVVFRRGSPIEDLTPDTFGAADGISDSGFIVGRAGPEGFIRPPGGSRQSVGALPGGSGSWLHAVDDSGVGVGLAYVPAYNPKGFLEPTERAAVWI
ncbi:MAG: hypothetical protein ACJ79H_08635, partial [Myxococcales bacterium]